MVSLKDIAAACNISVATVSKALNNYSDVSEKTKSLVHAKASELGYLPSMAAVALKTNRTYNLGILFVDGSNTGLQHEFFASVLQGIKIQAESQGYCITFITQRIGEKKVSYKEYCRHRQFDGVIVACTNFADSQVVDLIHSDIPLVTIDHYFPGTIAIMSDNISGIRDVMDYLYKMGHRKIAYIHGLSSSVTDDRLYSFMQCAAKYGLTVPESYLERCSYHDAENAIHCTKKLLSLADRPTCILYPDDFTAIGSINLIKSLGLSVPDDISIVGYDGISYAAIYEPSITTLKQDSLRMGRRAVSSLIGLIEHPENCSYEKIIIKGVLHTGNTVKKLI